MTVENKDYSLILSDSSSKRAEEKLYLKPMSLYVPAIAEQAVEELISNLVGTDKNSGKYVLTVTNNNNGVSVDKDFVILKN